MPHSQKNLGLKRDLGDSPYEEQLEGATQQLARLRSLRADGLSERRLLDLAHAHQGIIQSLNAALLVVDREGCITFCNPPAEQILAESAASLHGQLAWDWFQDVSGERTLLARTLATPFVSLTRPVRSRVLGS